MLKKTIFALFLLFTLQTVISCTCDCGDSNDIQKTYTGITISALNTAGFNNTVVEDSVHRNSFGLEVLVGFTSKVVADARTYHFTGFNSALATDCDCVGPTYIYDDDIDFIEIYTVSGDESIVVSSAFSIQNYNSEWISLSEFFQIREEWHDGFQIQLTDFEAMPERASVKVEVVMTSGKIFSATTKIITFI